MRLGTTVRRKDVMNRREVAITFKSHMFDTDEQMEIRAKGLHSIKNGKYYVIYTDEAEDGASVRNILKFDGESLDVSKIGTTRTNMFYKAGHKHTDIYRTPFGEYDMCIETEEYTFNEDSDRYQLAIVYNLALGGNHVSKCKVEIQIVY